VQSVLDALSCALIAVAARRWFGLRAGTVAGVVAAVYGPSIYFSGELLPTTLFVCLVTAAIASVAAPLPGAVASTGRSADVSGLPSATAPWRPRWLLAGGLWAAALVVRAEVLLAAPFVLVDAWRRGGHPGVARCAAPLMLVLSLSIAVNALYGRRFIVTTTGAGVNLWLGNNPSSDGVNPFIFGPLVPLADGVRTNAATGYEADQMFRQYAWFFLREHPGPAARLLWKKLVWTWVDRELPNTTDIDWQTAQSWVFWRPLFPFRFGMLLPLAVAGVALLGRQRRDLLPLWGLVVVGVGTNLIFFTNARFRLVMVPALVVLAAVALVRLPPLLRRGRTHSAQLLWPAVGLTIGAVAAWGNFYGVNQYFIPEIAVNTGALEREANHLDAAVRQLRRGLAAHPDDAVGWIHLALALEQRGARRAALRAYFDALARMPADRRLLDMAGSFFDRQRLDSRLLRSYAGATDDRAREAIVRQALPLLSDEPGLESQP